MTTLYIIVRNLAVSFDGNVLEHMYCTDEETIRSALQTSTSALDKLDFRVPENRKLIFDAIRKDHSVFEHVRYTVRKDREIMKYLVSQDSKYFDGASEQFRDDEDFVLSVNTNGKPIEKISPRLMADKSFILKLLDHDNRLLDLVDFSLKDLDVVLAAIAKPCEMPLLKYINDQIRRRSDVALIAVKSNGFNIQYIGDCANERAIVLAAVQNDGSVLKHAPKWALGDDEIVNAAFRSDSLVRYIVNKPLIGEGAVKIRGEQGERGISFFDIEMSRREEPALVMDLLKSDLRNFLDASTSIRNDKELHNLFDYKGFRYAGKALRNDFEFVKHLLESGVPNIFQYVGEDLRHNQEITKIAVKANPLDLYHATNSFRSDREIVLEAVRLDWRALSCADETMRSDDEIIEAAVWKDVRAMSFSMRRPHMDDRFEMLIIRSALAKAVRDGKTTFEEIVRRLLSADCVKNHVRQYQLNDHESIETTQELLNMLSDLTNNETFRSLVVEADPEASRHFGPSIARKLEY